jgi:hypothetical protein
LKVDKKFHLIHEKYILCSFWESQGEIIYYFLSFEKTKNKLKIKLNYTKSVKNTRFNPIYLFAKLKPKNFFLFSVRENNILFRLEIHEIYFRKSAKFLVQEEDLNVPSLIVITNDYLIIPVKYVGLAGS